jgi:hypothetical protein
VGMALHAPFLPFPLAARIDRLKREAAIRSSDALLSRRHWVIAEV